jgi:hypothetical protein
MTYRRISWLNLSGRILSMKEMEEDAVSVEVRTP